VTASGVVGLGTDIVETEQMTGLLARWGRRFKDRVFLPREQAYCDAKAFPSSHYAGRFAVKEAVTKAFGTGIGRDFGWLDIEVVRDGTSGAPSVTLSQRGAAWARSRGVTRVLISLAHTHRCAVAQALLIGTQPLDGQKGVCVS
jgi:holo-[acyl-carrier protein] synthase